MATADESKLSDRKREVLSLTRDGKTPTEVAAAMSISVNGVYEHMRVLRKDGFLPKSRRRRSGGNGRRKETPTAVVSSNGARGGFVVVETLRRAVSETDEAIESLRNEMAELSERQHRIAEETNMLSDLRQDLDGRVKALA